MSKTGQKGECTETTMNAQGVKCQLSASIQTCAAAQKTMPYHGNDMVPKNNWSKKRIECQVRNIVPSQNRGTHHQQQLHEMNDLAK